MVAPVLSRRDALVFAASALALPRAAPAEEIIDLKWEDLLPEDQPFVPNALKGLVQQEGPDLSSQQPASNGVRTDWNGQIVRLPGFIVPIDYNGTGVTAFILVPYVGAFIHVPPPPANQLVFVTSSEPYESKGLYEPVKVTGMFGAASMSTQLAEIGYALSADWVEPNS